MEGREGEEKISISKGRERKDGERVGMEGGEGGRRYQLVKAGKGRRGSFNNDEGKEEGRFQLNKGEGKIH